jgi:hypothetical protein
MRASSLPEFHSELSGLHPFPSVALHGLALLILLALWPAPLAYGQALAAVAASSSSINIPDHISDRLLNRIDDFNLTTIHGSTHPAVRNAIDNGRLAASKAMGDLVLVLTRSDAQQAALEAFNQQQYDPASPNYHHWLTPEEFGAAYGVSQADLNAVSNWLQDHGFTIQEIPPSHTSIRFSGNVGQVETAFHTEMHSLTSRGEAHIANTTDIQIPAALGSVVAGVKALHNFFPKAQHHAGPQLIRNSSGGWTPANNQSILPTPHPQLSGTSANVSEQVGALPEFGVNITGYEYQLLVPYDLATIYNYKSLWTAAQPINGTGQTIAIAGTSNIVLSDIATFRSATGLPAKAPSVIITNADSGTTALLDDRMENTLDVEWSGAAAPGANIVLVTSKQTSPSTDSLYLSESYIINNSVAKIMSVSYGECELGLGTAGNTEYLNLWHQAYTQGIAVFVSTGDSAAAVCDDGADGTSTDYAAQYGLSVSGMASTPYNVAVGGTDLNWTSSNFSSVNNSANMSNAVGYIAEVPWNDTVTNPIILSELNLGNGVSLSAEGWANALLKDYQTSARLGNDYLDLVPPVGGSGGVSACTVSSGDNPSTCSGGYAKPAWQTGVTGILSTDKRTVPDVSFFASNGFLGAAYLICDTLLPGPTASGTPASCNYASSGNAMEQAVGGTSVSSPLMAGIMALINQKAGASQGNPNAELYALAAQQNYSNCSAASVSNSGSCLFNDINSGNIQTPCYAGSLNCTVQTSGDKLGILSGYSATTGYDKATGLGSLNVANVAKAWPSAVPPAPVVGLSPSSLSFAATNTGSSTAAQTVTLTNTGTAALTLSSISITGSNTISGSSATSFLQTNTCGASLAASASCTISVTFKPAATGALSATLSFADNAANSPQTVALTGTGTTPAVSLSTASLAFAATNTGITTAAQTVTLRNTGTGAMTLSTISITGAYATSFGQTNNCGASLASGSSCTVSVTFTPLATGSLSATLSFADNVLYSPQTVTLSGTGTAPAVSLSPTSLSFASANSGITSVAQTVTLRNAGTGTMTLSAISITGTGATSFAQTNTCGATLAASTSCTVNVTFRPIASGSLSAQLSFADNAANSPQTVALSGTGTAPAVSLSPLSLAFSTTDVGNSSAAQTVTLRNTGTGPLTLSSIALTGTNATSFLQTNTCGTTLAATSSCTVSVTFKPLAAGSLSAQLNFTDNASGAAQTVALSGNAILLTPTVSLSTAQLSFPVTAVGSTISPSYSPAQAITLTNTGLGALLISSIAFSGNSPSAFAQMNNCPASLAASASCIILVRFAPTAAASQSATLLLTDNASPTQQSIALSGTGASAPILSLSASALNFGTVSVGGIHSVLALTLANNSATTPLNLSSIAISGTNAASFSQMSTCGPVIAPNSTCILLVQFAPAYTGAQSAQLTFTANNPATSTIVALTGSGQ